MSTFGEIFSSALQAPTEVAKGQHDRRRRRRVTWLQNMKLDEVSLVPKGANRRRFTIFKSAEGGPDVFSRLAKVLTEWSENWSSNS